MGLLTKHPAPAQSVRLSDEDIATAWNVAHEKTISHSHYDPERFDFIFANAIQDAMLAKGAAQPAVVQAYTSERLQGRFAFQPEHLGGWLVDQIAGKTFEPSFAKEFALAMLDALKTVKGE